MLIVKPDFQRRIDLPGAGPCPRPVDIDRTTAALTRLVSLRVYSFARGTAIDGEAEGDEVFIVLMRGAADFAVTAAGSTQAITLREDAARAFYMPPHSAYRLDAIADCDIAYARCMPMGDEAPPVRSFVPVDGRLDIGDHARGMTLSWAEMSPGSNDAPVTVDGGSPERFVHVRSRGGVARLSGQDIGDWESAVLRDGEVAMIEVKGEKIDVLTISAAMRGRSG